MSGIFISYRRDDIQAFADRLAEDLSRHFGEDEIFLDVRSINPGTKFPSELDRRVRQSDAVLVVIGPNWLGNDSGVPRIVQTGDWVRKEIETALHHQIRLIPVFAAGAKMPKEEQLPASLSEFRASHAIEFSRDHYQFDVERLIQELRKIVKPSRLLFLDLLATKQYESAVTKVTKALENFPNDADYHFCLALALLKGRLPKTLTLKEAREIENHLRISCNLDPQAGPYFVWAALKWDFFVANGFSRPEEVWVLLREAEDRALDEEALRAIRSTVRVSKGSPLADILPDVTQNNGDRPENT